MRRAATLLATALLLAFHAAPSVAADTPLAYTREVLERSGVAKQLTAVLVVKRLALERPSVTVSGLAVDDVYVFGSGMDYRGYWRGLPGIYAVRERA